VGGGPALHDLLPREDRTFDDGLFVDLIPTSCGFTNVRTCVSPADWAPGEDARGGVDRSAL